MTDTMAQPWTPQLQSICEFSCGECGDKPCWKLEGDYPPCDGCIATMHRHDASPDMLEALAGSAAHLQKAQEAALDFLNSETIAAKGDLLTRLLALVIGDEKSEIQAATAAALAKARGKE